MLVRSADDSGQGQCTGSAGQKSLLVSTAHKTAHRSSARASRGRVGKDKKM